MSTNGAHKTIADMSADARAVYDRLQAARVGDVISYAALETLTRREIQGKDRYVLSTAIRACLRDGIAFGTVRKIGMKRLADAEVVTDASSAIPRIRRLARNASRKMVAISDFDSLPNEAKVRHNAVLSIFGVITQMATERSVARIEKKVAKANQTLAMAATLDAFK